MELIRVLPSQSKLWEQVWRLYVDSFPEYERRRISSHTRACDDPEFHTCIAIENGNLMALLFFWRREDMIYVEHIAVNQEMRGRSIGSTVLGNFLSQNQGCTVILEIDPPVDDISIRRLSFYKRLGFAENDYPYIHPSYSRKGHGHELRILSHPHAISVAEFDLFKKFVDDKVLSYID